MEAAAVNMKRGSHAIRTRWAVWFAVLIAVFSAFAPTVSHALALTHRGAPMETSYCSSMGIVESVSDSTDGQGSAAALAHCPFCLHATDRLAPPPESIVYPLLVQEGQQRVTAQTAVLYSGESYLRAEPRGPPD
jgi:hypothetical protein